jgi:hypothetical protein
MNIIFVMEIVNYACVCVCVRVFRYSGIVRGFILVCFLQVQSIVCNLNIHHRRGPQMDTSFNCRVERVLTWPISLTKVGSIRGPNLISVFGE